MNPNRSIRNIMQSMTLADALSVAEGIGCTVRQGKGGEIVVRSPDGLRVKVVNSRRKHPPMHLLTFIRSIDAGAIA